MLHLIAERLPAPATIAPRIAAALPVPWKARWWRLYSDPLQLRTSLDVYRAVTVWGAATAAAPDEVAALFRCYHDDGTTGYPNIIWQLCEAHELHPDAPWPPEWPCGLSVRSFKTW